MFSLSPQTIGIVAVAVVFYIIRYVNYTDTPKIKGLPEIPGVPIFGNLLQFGVYHAKVAGELAKKYGPVFQVRFGNRVCGSLFRSRVPQFVFHMTKTVPAHCVCKYVRVRQGNLGDTTIGLDFKTYSTHIPFRSLNLARLHDRDFSLG